MTLQYDKLYVDNAVYIFNEDIDSIELLNVAEIEAEYRSLVGDPTIRTANQPKVCFLVPSERETFEESKSL